jgi:flagellar basal body-associated protein FliL
MYFVIFNKDIIIIIIVIIVIIVIIIIYVMVCWLFSGQLLDHRSWTIPDLSLNFKYSYCNIKS